jgi:hypothetical protein
MPEQAPANDKIKLALREIGFCDDLRVKIANGEIVAICKQVIQRTPRAGVRTAITIEEEITR